MSRLRDAMKRVLVVAIVVAIAGYGGVTQASAVPPCWPDCGPTEEPPDPPAEPFPTPPPPSDPTAPGPHDDAPTENLRRIANGLNYYGVSVTSIYWVERARNVTNPVEISISFGGRRVTQNYDNVNGNRLKVDFPANDGSKRSEWIHATLTETTPTGYQNYSIVSTREIEPRFNVTLSPLHFHELGNCDLGTPVDPVVNWTGLEGDSISQVELDPGYGDQHVEGGAVASLHSAPFNATRSNVSVSSGLRLPGVLWWDEDPGLGFIGRQAPKGGPLLPGTSRRVVFTLPDNGDEPVGVPDCSAEFIYDITYEVITYP